MWWGQSRRHCRSPPSEVEAEQDPDYPGTPSPNESSSSSGVSRLAEMDFQLIFISGRAIACTATQESSVGWAKAQAAPILQVQAKHIRILRNATVLANDELKLFDVLGPCNKLYAVATVNVAYESD